MNNDEKKVVVYTAIAGGFDKLIQHTYITNAFHYVCFSDQPVVDSGMWEVRLMEKSNIDNVRRARYYKTHPHKVLQDFQYSVWIDANIDINGPDLENRVHELISNNESICCNTHGRRSCIYEEANHCLHAHVDEPEVIYRQVEYLRDEKFPENHGLFETNILFRRHNEPEIMLMMDEWWWMIATFSRRDQLSFTYMLYKHQVKCSNLFQENARSREDFHINKHNSIIYLIIFFDSGSGFNVKEAVIERCVVAPNNQFMLSFRLTQYLKVNSIKISFITANSYKVKIERIRGWRSRGDAIDLNLGIINSSGIKLDEDYLLLQAADPSIIISIAEPFPKIEISGFLNNIDKFGYAKIWQQSVEKIIYNYILGSVTWRTGRIITWLPRVILRLIKKIKKAAYNFEQNRTN